MTFAPAVAAAAGFGAGWYAACRRARARDERRERLFAFVSHELTTPLTGIQLTVRNFMSGVFGELPEAHRSWFQMMNDQLDAAGGLVADLNDLFHLEFADRMRVERGPASLGELAQDAALRLRPQAERWGLKWTAEIPEGLPAVDGDPYRLGRVIKSLLAHALKFSPQDGEVSLSLRPEGGGVAAVIRYRPVELHADDEARLFDRFYPVDHDGGAKVLKTSGVGLSVAQETVRRHGGTLTFSQEPSGWSRFTLTLPGRGEK